MRRLNSCGHQVCVGHRDTTMRASALSLSSFFKHLVSSGIWQLSRTEEKDKQTFKSMERRKHQHE